MDIPAPIRRPRFFWQGLLIVLPAIGLAAMGVWSLRQDRILALHEATETAKKIVADLVEVRLPAAFRVDLPNSELWLQPAGTALRPEDDPVLTLARGLAKRTVCLIDAYGRLLYPPPYEALSAPEPLDELTLDSEQLEAWQLAQRSLFVIRDWALALEALDQFLARKPPWRFAGLAHYQRGVSLAKQNQASAAVAELRTVTTDFQPLLADSGMPLRLYAQLQLLKLTEADYAPGVSRSALVNEICGFAVAHPSSFSPLWLEKAADQGRDTSRNASNWLADWTAHQNARALYTQYQQTLPLNLSAGGFYPSVSWSTADGLWLIWPQPDSTNWWLSAWSETNARRLAEQTLAFQPRPAYVGVAIEIAGKRLAGFTGPAELLAVSAEPSPGLGSIQGIKARVYLTNPALFYGHQRRRTLWFGALIVLSTGAVLAGFFTAWRAFKRQQCLSEMKTNFVSSVSHELRAPIASVRLMAEELEDLNPLDQAKSSEYHRFIVQECRRLSALIENVLDFARHEQGRTRYEMQPTDLTALVKETVRIMGVYGNEKRMQLALAIHGEPVEIELDGRAIQQVVVNLVDNAIKHSPPGSTVVIGLDYPTADTAAMSSPVDGWVRLWVEDQGEGIPAEDHERIFERFYRRGSELRRETQGVGLGLAIVKYVTEAHGGRIRIRSAVGQGSRFTVELPVAPVT